MHLSVFDFSQHSFLNQSAVKESQRDGRNHSGIKKTKNLNGKKKEGMERKKEKEITQTTYMTNVGDRVSP